jgi:hypothetical protein
VGWWPVSATDRLIALLEQPGAGDPGVREVTRALRRIPVHLADQFDHWQTIVDAVGVERAAYMAVDAAHAAHKRWLAG